jgi:magnesium transporter
VSVELSLAEAFADVHPAGAARVVEQASEQVAAELLAALDSAVAARVIADMAPIAAARALEALPEDHAAEIVRALPLDLAAALVRRVPEEARPRLVAAAGDERRGRALAELLHHPPDSAGALMDPLVLAVPAGITAGEALGRVRRAPETAMYYLYVIGDENRLVGVVNQRELMLASPVEPLTTLMRARPDSVSANATREAIAAHPGWQRVHALPVVDKNERFLGAIRYETIRRIESELGQSARVADPRVTAEALGELYGLGLAGLAELASSAVRGSGARRGGAS